MHCDRGSHGHGTNEQLWTRCLRGHSQGRTQWEAEGPSVTDNYGGKASDCVCQTLLLSLHKADRPQSSLWEKKKQKNPEWLFKVLHESYTGQASQGPTQIVSFLPGLGEPSSRRFLLVYVSKASWFGTRSRLSSPMPLVLSKPASLLGYRVSADTEAYSLGREEPTLVHLRDSIWREFGWGLFSHSFIWPSMHPHLKFCYLYKLKANNAFIGMEADVCWIALPRILNS